jgi:hypothetical protein
MAKSIDQQIKDAMAKKVVGLTTEICKAVVLELYKRITANSLQVGIAYGSPVLTGQYYTSHTIAPGRISIVIYGPARNVKGHLNQARIGTDAGIYPYMDSSRPASRTCIMREG